MKKKEDTLVQGGNGLGKRRDSGREHVPTQDERGGLISKEKNTTNKQTKKGRRRVEKKKPEISKPTWD